MEKGQFLDQGSRTYYKPFATRSPVLIFLLVVTVILIGLVEYACRIIPVHVGIGTLGNVMSDVSSLRDDLEKRQTEIYSPTTDPPVWSATPVLTSPDVTSTPAGGYLRIGDDTPPSITVAPQSGYLSVGTEPTTTAPGDPNDDFLPSDYESFVSGIVASTPDSGYLSLENGDGSTVYGTVAVTPSSGYLEVGGGSAQPTGVLGAKPYPGDSAFGPIGIPPPPPAAGYLSINGAKVTSIYDPVVVVSDGTTMTLAPTPFIVVENGVTSTHTPPWPRPVITTSPGSPNSGYLEATDSSPPAPSATIVNSTGTYFVYRGGETVAAPQITLRQYLLVSFVPLIVAALFTIPWRIVDNTLREMEPFYQLHRRGGASAEHSLNLDYGSTWLLTTPFIAGLRGHFFVFWSSLISVLVLALSPLSSETFFVSLSGNCGPNMPPCRATWGVYLLLARVVEGILAFIAALVALLLIFGFRRKSGVYSEPLSIAGLAALFHGSPLLRGFREIDSRVNNEQLKEILAGKRYGISGFTAYDYRPCYGIMPADAESEAGFASVARTGRRGQYRLVDGSEVQRDAFGMPVSGEVIEDKLSLWGRAKPQLLNSAVLFLVTGLLTLITYYHWSSGEDGFEWFMDSQGFGVRFMMASLGVLLNTLWSTVDEDLRKLEPYHRLLLGSARAEDSILVPVWVDPFSALLPSLRRGHFVVSLICLDSILSEFLPIALANINFSPAMTKEAYEGCTYVAMAILIIMLISILILIFRPRHHIRPLPRKPVTLASILLYITSLQDGDGPSMVDQMEGMSLLGTKERNVRVKALNEYYTMGVGVRNDLRIDVERRIRRLWADE